MGDLTKNFSKKEFACKCGCGSDRIDMGLVRKLQKVRNEIGLAVKVNSGCRCVLHNLAVGGSGDSSHLRGLAADISCIDMKLLLEKALGVFKRVGISGGYIHVDVDEKKPQDIYWVYVE